MSIRTIIALLAFAGCVPAAAAEQDNPEPGQFRPDPLEPVRVYTYPDDYEKYYGGAGPAPRFKFEVDDADATFRVDAATTFGSGPRAFTPVRSLFNGMPE